jgi:hypothetical protein
MTTFTGSVYTARTSRASVFKVLHIDNVTFLSDCGFTREYGQRLPDPPEFRKRQSQFQRLSTTLVNLRHTSPTTDRGYYLYDISTESLVLIDSVITFRT